MVLRRIRQSVALLILVVAACGCASLIAQNAPSSSRNSQPSHRAGTSIDPGSVSNGVYRNSPLGFTCKIPQGWVLRTEEVNSQDDASDKSTDTAKSASGGRVLLAAFSRPPQARGEDVNASILIAAEPASAYPGLKDAAQYFGPLTEVAKAQGFDVDEEPYEFAVGSKNLVRSDFEKDVGSRVMHQSTLAMLARGYAVSFTFIGGTEDEVEELIGGLSFTVSKGVSQPRRP
jgi:hypothetical protein